MPGVSYYDSAQIVFLVLNGRVVITDRIISLWQNENRVTSLSLDTVVLS